MDQKTTKSMSEALEILSCLGSNYITEKRLLSCAKRHVAIGAFEQAELVGVVVARPLRAREVRLLEERIRRLGDMTLHLPRTKVGYLDALAVKKTYRNLGKDSEPGIGSILVREAEANMKGLGCTLAIGEAWVSGLGDESGNLLLRAGYQLKAEIPAYWSSDRFDCPVCGNECKCTALIFIKKL